MGYWLLIVGCWLLVERRRFSCVDRLIRVCVLFAPYQSSSGYTISPIILRYFFDSSSMIYRRNIEEISKKYRTNEDSIRWQMYAKGMATACQLLRSGESFHPPARGLSPRSGLPAVVRIRLAQLRGKKPPPALCDTLQTPVQSESLEVDA